MNKKFCRMGENYAFIKPNGDVERCCKDHSMSLGNVITGTFKLLEEAKECEVEDCSCWRRMIVGKDDEWSKYWGETWDQFYALKIEEVLLFVQNKQISYDEGILKVDELMLKIKNLTHYIQRIKQIKHDIICSCLLDGYKYINNNMFKEANQFIEHLLEKHSKYMLNDTFLHVYIYIVRMYMKSLEFEKAKEYIYIAMKYNKNYPSLYKLLAMIYFELKDYRNSKLMFVESIKYAKKSNNHKELSEIYYEISICFEKYYKNNKQMFEFSQHSKKMLKILRKANMYDTNNSCVFEKIKQLEKEN